MLKMKLLIVPVIIYLNMFLTNAGETNILHGPSDVFDGIPKPLHLEAELHVGPNEPRFMKNRDIKKLERIFGHIFRFGRSLDNLNQNDDDLLGPKHSQISKVKRAPNDDASTVELYDDNDEENEDNEETVDDFIYDSIEEDTTVENDVLDEVSTVSNDDLAKIGTHDSPQVQVANTKYHFPLLPNFNPQFFLEPINKKISELSNFFIHPNYGVHIPNPIEVVKDIKRKGANILQGVNQAIFNPLDYPFPYRRARQLVDDDVQFQNDLRDTIYLYHTLFRQAVIKNTKNLFINYIRQMLKEYQERYRDYNYKLKPALDLNAYKFPFLALETLNNITTPRPVVEEIAAPTFVPLVPIVTSSTQNTVSTASTSKTTTQEGTLVSLVPVTTEKSTTVSSTSTTLKPVTEESTFVPLAPLVTTEKGSTTQSTAASTSRTTKRPLGTTDGETVVVFDASSSTTVATG